MREQRREARASRVIYRTEKMGKVNPILFISIRALQTLSDFVSLLNLRWGGGNLPHLLLLYVFVCLSEFARRWPFKFSLEHGRMVAAQNGGGLPSKPAFPSSSGTVLTVGGWL